MNRQQITKSRIEKRKSKEEISRTSTPFVVGGGCQVAISSIMRGVVIRPPPPSSP